MILLLLVFTFTWSVQGQSRLSMTFDGNPITNQALLYIEDITLRNRPNTLGNPNELGALVCRSSRSSDTVSWRYVRGGLVRSGNFPDIFLQVVSGNVARLFLSIPYAEGSNSNLNGIWHCRLNPEGGTGESSFEDEIHVGIYSRDTGLGNIMSNPTITLQSPSFGSTPPTFTLVGDTGGGPPTTYTWTRNGQGITNNASYSISIGVREVTRLIDYEQSYYRSILAVTGTLPGVYQYSVTNSATSGTRTSSFTIESAPQPPTNVIAVQNGQNTVQVSWTSTGIRHVVTSNPGGVNMNNAASPQTVTLQPLAEYSISVTAFGQHYGATAAPVQVTVRGPLPPNVATSSVTATSVIVSSTQPQFSFTPSSYTVALMRVTGSGPCPSDEDNRPAIPATNPMEFTGLHGVSTYRVTVTANFNSFGSSSSMSSSMEFTTLSGPPTGAPRDVTPTTTSTSIMVTWTAIECIERSGEITGYEVVFQRVDGTATTDGQVVGQTFTASGLQPYTEYRFQVRGVNSAGMGAFTTAITIRTDEDVPGAVSNFITDRQFISVTFSWSAPVEPNGIIIAYELTYTVNNTNSVARNVSTTTFTIDFDVSTLVSGISIRAYTIVGPGTFAAASDVRIQADPAIPVVRNVQVMQIQGSVSSVLVSWDRSTSSAVTAYTVYYSPVSGRKRQANEMSKTVPGSENSARIDGLESGMMYQFQVTVTVSFRGMAEEGERTKLSNATLITIASSEKCTDMKVAISVSVVVTFLLTVMLNTSLLLLGYCFLQSRHNNPLKESMAATSGIAMKENVAYGPVTSSQQPQDCIYDQPDCKTESAYYNMVKLIES